MKTHATNDTYDDRLARLADAWARLIEEGSEPAARESDQVTDKICRQLANIEDVMLKLPAQGPRLRTHSGPSADDGGESEA